ncbi:hypothetical protein ACH4TP_32970 [Streptomyces sp. NPDC021012]|uniref:hypothetical protein n=1 Tax=Streptomyces sp. NPDC021012 TaxID=3365107 RepID=UPI0037B1D35E
MNKTSALLGALSTALLLTAAVPASTAASAKTQPVKAVFGGIVDKDHPAVPIGSKLPQSFAPAPATVLPTLTKAAEDAAKVMPTENDRQRSLLGGPVPHSTPFVTANRPDPLSCMIPPCPSHKSPGTAPP